MKNKILSIFFLFSTSLFGSTYSLEVDINNLKNNKGVVLCNLYNNAHNFPDKNFNKFYKQIKSKIINKSAKIIFKNLPKGKYLVSVIHDENNNGKIDIGLMLPVEGVGVSNYPSINLFHRPNFENGSFLLKGNIKIKIVMHYF